MPIKKPANAGFFIGINNVLSEVFKTGGFEQSRNANYPELKQDKELEKSIVNLGASINREDK